MEGNYFPTDWKIAIICRVFKGKGKIRKPGNYRRITRLSALGKIYSGMLAGRLRDWLINNRILSKLQAGFVINKRTTDNIFVIKSTIDKYLKVKKRACLLVYGGPRKTFDSIHRETLWFKMRKKE
jgi:hypothetical protein